MPNDNPGQYAPSASLMEEASSWKEDEVITVTLSPTAARLILGMIEDSDENLFDSTEARAVRWMFQQIVEDYPAPPA
ncbi:MAG: hypothetical protein KIT11_05540 [Fimbriimonadaceae bacterium]|nr:hypothetical protein [Fimbriimonadaceae bacterium]QYK56644.1 MAG: hypothetical protein KF733_03980 [Fimbriimonadaceae bacterium]